MEITPIQSSEEAALAAVNLGPAIPPSSPIPETTESLTHTYGLLILERDPKGEPTWFACKFCPVFGSTKQREGYLRLYRAPFKRSQIEAHLNRDHADQWAQYHPLDLEQKRHFFQGKRLPPPAVFQERMKQLERAWAPIPRKRKAQKQGVHATAEIRNVRPMKRHKLFIVDNIRTPLAIGDDWIGRNSCRPAESTAQNVLYESKKCRRPLPGRNLAKLLTGVLQRYSEPFPEDVRRLVKRIANSADMQDVPIAPPWSAGDTVTLSARTLFYLLRGLPVDVASTLLQESAQFGWPLAQPSEVDVKMSDIVDGPDAKQENTTDVSLPDTKPVPEQESLVPFVSDTAHFIEMASFLALKRIIEGRHTWAISLATRPCPMRSDVLEIMIPVLSPSLESSCKSKAKKVPPSTNTKNQPMAIETDKQPPDAADLEDSMDHDLHAQSFVKISGTKLLSLAVTVFLLDVARENLSQTMPVTQRIGVRERVRLVLIDTLDFFSEAIGPNRTSAALRDIANNRKLSTAWLLSASTDDEAFESANVSYKAAGLRMSDLSEVEQQVEKEVLSGLRLCVRTARDSLRQSFYSPTIYAREVLNRAVNDFDTTMPALRQIPTEQDPLHLISVRDKADTVDTVTRFLDFVCPDWPRKLIGINSNISGESPLKPLETKLVEALRQRKGCDFETVDKSDDKSPILPSVIMNMMPPQFEDLTASYIKANSIPQDGFVDKLRKQRETFLNRKQGKLKDSWTSHEDLHALVAFVRAIELLRSRKHFNIASATCLSGIFSGETDDADTIDRDIERILRARTLLGVEQSQMLEEEGPGILWADTSPWKDYLVSWGGNWSNLMLCASN